ncbi:MAG: IPT/TIG domain-containing protein, partial [Leptospiraceae bacterium]|nr:IPT/TIG domain-containing protein [Leptospiraceae bacterium]
LGLMDFKKIIFLVLLLLLSRCKSDDNEYNDSLSILTGLSPTYQSSISSVTPRRGSPYIKSEYLEYQASKVLIKGRNFSYLPSELSVTFNDIPAQIEYSSDTEIYTSVPTGASSGLLKIAKSGGTCYSLDGKSGYNCSAIDYYVDCYASSNKAFGEEVVITPGVFNSVTFEKTGLKAFRSDLPQGNYTLAVSCISTVGIQTFSNSCVPTTHTTSEVNPQVSITGGYTIQFLIYSIEGNCTIGIF